MAYSIQIVYKNIVLKLNALYTYEEARAMADRLVEHFFDLTPTQRVIAGATMADEDKISLMNEAANKLLHNVPLQYVLGSAFFMDMEFIVNSSVLIPRPETEEMVSLILKHYSDTKAETALRVLDIGTGSGCIAIAVKKQFPESNVSAIDISEDALAVASENAFRNEVEIDFLKVDILDQAQWKRLPMFDLIVSNPPYVTNNEKAYMQPNVLDYEPHSALFVPDSDPLVFYSGIMNFTKASLMNGGALWLEINEAFGQEVLSLFEDNMFKERELLKDMFGKNRFVKVTK